MNKCKNKRILVSLSAIIVYISIVSLISALEIKSGSSEDITLFLKNTSSGEPMTGANCTLDVWNPSNSKILVNGSMTALGDGFYYFSTLTNWTALGDYRVMARCQVGAKSYYSAMSFKVVGTTVEEWFVILNATTNQTLSYLQNTIYPAIDDTESKLNELLANNTNIWDKLVEVQDNITTNYNQIIKAQDMITSTNFSVMNELENNRLRLLDMNSTLNKIYTNITQTVNPKLDQLQADVDLIKGYTDTLEAGQEAILGNLSIVIANLTTIKAELDTINANTNTVTNYVDTLEDSLNCNGTTDTPICSMLVQMNTTINTINTNTDSLESGQATIINYVDTLESGQAALMSSTEQIKEYLNCTINITNSMCWMLSLIQAYTDTLESGQATIINYVDTLEANQSVILSNLSTISGDVINIGANQTLILQELSTIKGYTDSLESGISNLGSDIHSWSINATARFDTIDSSLTSIYTDTQALLATLQAMNSSDTAALQNILTVITQTNATSNEIKAYLEGAITDYLASINTTVVQINETVTEILNVVLDINSTLGSVHSDTQSLLAKWGSYTAEQIYNNITSIETKVDSLQAWMESFNATEQQRYISLMAEVDSVEEIIEMIRTEIGFNGTGYTAYSYLVQLESKLVEINTTIINKIEFEANLTRTQIIDTIQNSTTQIISEINDNENKLDSILGAWGSITAESIVANITDNRNKLIELQNWVIAFNTTEAARHNLTASLTQDVLAWLGLFNDTEAYRHNQTQAMIDSVFNEVNDTEELSNQIIAMLGYYGMNSTLYDDVQALIAYNVNISILVNNIDMTTRNTQSIINDTVIPKIDNALSNTSALLDKWGSYTAETLWQKTGAVESKVDAIQIWLDSFNTTEQSRYAAIIAEINDTKEQIVALRNELDFTGKNITAYEYLVQLESQLTSVNSSLWIKIATEANLTREELISVISSNTSAIINDMNMNLLREVNDTIIKTVNESIGNKLNILLAKWGFYTVDDILKNITAARNSVLTLENWLQSYLTGVNGTGAIRYYLENVLFNEVDDTEELSNLIIAQLGYSGSNTTLYADMENLASQQAFVIALAQEINLTTHTIDDKLDLINSVLDLAYNDTRAIIGKWETYNMSQLFTKLGYIEDYVLALNVTNIFECNGTSCNISIDNSAVLQVLNNVRAELGFQGQSQTAYEYFVELESELIVMDYNIQTKIETEHLATRQQIEQAIMSNTTAIIAEINDNQNDLNTLINKWGEYSAQDIISNISDVRTRVIDLNSWIILFNDTEAARHNESQLLINDVLSWLGIFNQTEAARHNLTQTKIDDILTVSNEIKGLTNEIIAELGYNGTGHTAYGDTVQLMNMIAVLTEMVGRITETDYVDLVAGANAVALPKQPTNISVQYVMANITGSYERVDHWDDINQSWMIYNPSAPFGNTLTNMTTSKVYWIYVNVTSVRLHIK